MYRDYDPYEESPFHDAGYRMMCEKANNNSGVVAKDLRTNTVSVYPNPASGGKLNVQFGNFTAGKYIVQIGEMQGKTVLQKELKISGSQTVNLGVSSISSGAYLLRVIDENGRNVSIKNVIISK